MLIVIIKPTEYGEINPHRKLPYEYEKIRRTTSKAVKIPGQPLDYDGQVVLASIPCAGIFFSNAFILP